MGVGVSVSINGGDIFVQIRIIRTPVQHADLLSLVYKRSALLEHVHGAQHLAALFPELLTAVAGDDAGMIVVFQIQHVPGLSMKAGLPVPDSPFVFSQ